MPVAACISRSSTDNEVVSRKSTWIEDEERFLAAARGGDRAAFGELVGRSADKVFHTTLRITGNREDAEDALQESFLSALHHLHDFDGRSRFSTWLTRIAINAALMRMRKNRTLREVPIETKAEPGEEPDPHDLASDVPNPEEWYVEHERHNILREAVFNLRPALRKAVEVYHIKERSIRETAEVLDISMEAVKGRLYHARVVLRRTPQIRSIRESDLESATGPVANL
jgi:RNA polymerase sigma factor (sigma-70 family)